MERKYLKNKTFIKVCELLKLSPKSLCEIYFLKDCSSQDHFKEGNEVKLDENATS